MNNIMNTLLNSHDYFEDFISRSTYHSNGIEGNTLTYADTYAIIFNDNSFTVNAKPREIYEAINHKYAINKVIDYVRLGGTELSEQFIIDIGKQINKNISEIGGYRTVGVQIRGAEHIPPAPNELNQAMMYFVNNYNHYQTDNVFEKIALYHLEFERIHPFEDGNGRTGRLLINYELLKNNIAPVVIPKEERSKYFNFLATQNKDELSKYIEELSNIEMERLTQFVSKTIEINKDTLRPSHKGIRM